MAESRLVSLPINSHRSFRSILIKSFIADRVSFTAVDETDRRRMRVTRGSDENLRPRTDTEAPWRTTGESAYSRLIAKTGSNQPLISDGESRVPQQQQQRRRQERRLSNQRISRRTMEDRDDNTLVTSSARVCLSITSLTTSLLTPACARLRTRALINGVAIVGAVTSLDSPIPQVIIRGSQD